MSIWITRELRPLTMSTITGRITGRLVLTTIPPIRMQQSGLRQQKQMVFKS